MKKIILLAIFIFLWSIFIICYRDFSKNYQHEPENDYITDYEYFNGDYYDNYE